MVDIQSTAAEIRRGKKRKKKERKIEITGQKYNGLPYYIGQRDRFQILPLPRVRARRAGLAATADP